MFLVNSRYRHFSATASSSGGEPLHQLRHTFSRSYGAFLPSSLTWVLSSALGYSPRPPESVWGTVPHYSTQYAAFLGSMGSLTLLGKAHRHHLSASGPRFIPTDPAYWLEPPLPHGGSATLLRPCSAHSGRHGNINPFPITYASRPRLRGRLTLRGLPLRRKPWAYGEQACNLFYRYS